MSHKYKKVCVTGGAGFIGSHLVRALLIKGVSVSVLDNLSVGRRENIPDGVEFIEGDILDKGAVDRAIDNCDAVFHLAARVAIRSSFDYVIDDTQTNVTGTANVVTCACNSNSVEKIISASSMAVYADAETPAPINEDHLLSPVSPYGISKLASEQLTHTICAKAGKQSSVLRLFNTYGKGQAYSPYVGVVTIFINRLRDGIAPTIFGDGEQCRDFVHVEDVAAGFVNAMNSDTTGETMNIGTGIATSVNKVFDHVRRSMNSKLEAKLQPNVPGELRYSVADISKASELIGYRPNYTFGESISDVVRDLVSE